MLRFKTEYDFVPHEAVVSQLDCHQECVYAAFGKVLLISL